MKEPPHTWLTFTVHKSQYCTQVIARVKKAKHAEKNKITWYHNFLDSEELQGTHKNSLDPFNSKLTTLNKRGGLWTFPSNLALCAALRRFRIVDWAMRILGTLFKTFSFFYFLFLYNFKSEAYFFMTWNNFPCNFFPLNVVGILNLTK